LLASFAPLIWFLSVAAVERRWHDAYLKLARLLGLPAYRFPSLDPIMSRWSS
jgi:hypothetical protein